jgi:inner membrane protein
MSVMPDLDAAVGILLGNLGRYHNNIAGTPVFGALVAFGAACLAGFARRSAGMRVFSLTFVCYQLHVLMDYLTIGRGLMLLWPLSDERFRPPVHLFYGLRWSDGVFSTRHFITLFSELGFVLVLLLVFWFRSSRRFADK